jgi:hypothetical protein
VVPPQRPERPGATSSNAGTKKKEAQQKGKKAEKLKEVAGKAMTAFSMARGAEVSTHERITSRVLHQLQTTVASSEVRPSAVSTEVGSLSVAVRERVCSLFKPVSASLNGANRGVDL